eukprot:15559551-Heterocapsa_arctica.AAC.1
MATLPCWLLRWTLNGPHLCARLLFPFLNQKLSHYCLNHPSMMSTLTIWCALDAASRINWGATETWGTEI